MISFEEIRDKECEKIGKIFSRYEGETLEYAREVLESFANIAADGEFRVAIDFLYDALLVRIESEGEYIFVYPIPLTDGADVKACLLAVAEYSRRESLPLSFTDVPREDIGVIGGVFPHIDARIYDDDEDTFFVRVLNECTRFEGEPNITLGELTLNAISHSDKADYERLCRDRELNKYWGYDVYADNPEADGEYLLQVSEFEKQAGVALALAVRWRGEFVGEGVIYDFDYFGCASLGVRILPEYQARGIGSRAVEALISLSARLGLKEVRCEIMAENVSSLRMTDKFMPREKEACGRVYYRLTL